MGYSDLVIADGAVGYWRLGESSGTTAADEISTNDGTYNNTPTLGESGPLSGDSNTAIRLTRSSNEYVEIPDSDLWTITNNTGNEFTVEFWVKWADYPDNNTERQYVISKGLGEWAFQCFEPSLGSQPRFIVWDASGNEIALCHWGGTPTENVWYHVVAGYDGSAAFLYVNGVSKNSNASHPGTLNDYVAGSQGLIIGARNNSPLQCHDGWVDEVAIYDYALSGTDALFHYDVGVGNETFDPNVTAEVDNAPAVTHTGLDATIFIGAGAAVDSTPEVSFIGLDPTLDIAGNVIVSANEANLTFDGKSPLAAGVYPFIKYKDEVLSDSPLLYWRFEEPTGSTTVVDSSGNGKTATYNHATSGEKKPALTGNLGAGDLGYSSDGTARYIANSNTTAIVDTNWTWEAWVKGTTYIYSDSWTSPSGTNTVGLRIDKSDGVSWKVKIASNLSNARHTINLGNPSTLTSGDWIHMVVVMLRDDALTEIAGVYINGSLVATSTESVSASEASRLIHPRIGADLNAFGSGSHSYFASSINELAIYDGVLTQAGVEAHYNASLVPASATVEVESPPAVTFTGLDADHSGQIGVSIELDSASAMSFVGQAPTLLINGGPVILTDPVSVSFVGLEQTVEVVRHIEEELENVPTISHRGLSPKIYIYTGDLEFAFIDPEYTGYTGLDGVELIGVDLGSALYGQEKIFGFRLANLVNIPCNFTITASSDNNLADMVTFSLDKVDYDDSLLIESVQPNAVTDVIWAKVSVTTDAYIDLGTFLVDVEQQNG